MKGEVQLGTVYLVGAGPGDPELLTLRALRLLRSADAILHDDLVPAEILRHASRLAFVENVGKRCGAKSITQSQINSRMIGFARAGFNVVRLKSGDPLLFGRAGEELEALDRAGIACEIVSGVTAASAAAAAAQISLTDRRASSQLVFLTGHRSASQEIEIPSPSSGGKTIAVYMPAGDYSPLAEAFRAAGWAGDTPCVLVSAASTSQQQIVRATLASLGEIDRLPAPTILLVGAVTAARVAEAANAFSQPRAEAVGDSALEAACI